MSLITIAKGIFNKNDKFSINKYVLLLYHTSFVFSERTISSLSALHIAETPDHFKIIQMHTAAVLLYLSNVHVLLNYGNVAQSMNDKIKSCLIVKFRKKMKFDFDRFYTNLDIEYRSCEFIAPLRADKWDKDKCIISIYLSRIIQDCGKEFVNFDLIQHINMTTLVEYYMDIFSGFESILYEFQINCEKL